MIDNHLSKFKNHTMSVNDYNIKTLANLLNLHISETMDYVQQTSESMICNKFQKMLQDLTSKKED